MCLCTPRNVDAVSTKYRLAAQVLDVLLFLPTTPSSQTSTPHLQQNPLLSHMAGPGAPWGCVAEFGSEMKRTRALVNGGLSGGVVLFTNDLF